MSLANRIDRIINHKGWCWFLPAAVSSAVSHLKLLHDAAQNGVETYRKWWEQERATTARQREHIEKLEKQNFDLHEQLQAELANLVKAEETVKEVERRHRNDAHALNVTVREKEDKIKELREQLATDLWKVRSEELSEELTRMKGQLEKSKTALNQQNEDKIARIKVLEKRVQEMTNANAEMNEQLTVAQDQSARLIQKFRDFVGELTAA